MKLKLVFLTAMLLSGWMKGQEHLTGFVGGKNESGKISAVPGANVYWAGTAVGTTSDDKGEFHIPLSENSNKLVISLVGYISDTLTISTNDFIEVLLKEEQHELDKVEVVGNTNSTYSDFLSVENKSVVTQKELKKAACCTLSESFETNPSIDVSFADAITGAKQIEMLGLSGIYTQSTIENLPYFRGLMSTVGLTYIPGSWVKSINVSKGIGSVANGFESITGQIDVDLKKPFSIDEKPLYLNLYGDYDRRFEGNFNYRFALNDRISSVTLLHASTRKHKYDMNGDNFIDMPTFSIYNLMQRWQYISENGWQSQLGFQIVSEEKKGGTFHNSNYSYNTDSKQFNIYGKLGYVFPDQSIKSFGIQWSFNNFQNNSLFGNRNYSGKEKNGYLNFIYQSMLGSPDHKFRTGASFIYDEFNETFLDNNYSRIEKIPGAFFEYTYSNGDSFSAILGARGDYHNEYGFIFTPRIHLRYTPNPDWVFRAVAGRGFRTSNIFTEYSSVFASSRNISINRQNNFGYGLAQERAWNFGFSATHYFLFDYREGTISVDFYRTQFENATIADIDTNPQSINFSSVKNGSYSNSLQVELNFQPLERFDTRIAYRFLDVKQKTNGVWLDRALSSKNRVLLNFAYSTEKENENDSQMNYDLTVNWFGEKRIPSTASNPDGLQSRNYSPAFAVVNAQVTCSFTKDFDLYAGIENLFDFRQKDLIIDPENPNGKYFDASLIWGPVNGRMIYTGLRYSL
jgi:outer membrane receptor for ferrienterochelin and colicins